MPGPRGQFKKWRKIGSARGGQALYWGVQQGDSSGDIYTSDGIPTETGLYRSVGAARKAAKSAWYEDFRANGRRGEKLMAGKRTAAQIRATKKLVAMCKARARAWVRAGMTARNPERKSGPTLTLAQGRKLYELGKRAPETPVAIRPNGRGVTIVTGKAVRKLKRR